MNQCCELGLRLVGKPKNKEMRECTECGQIWVRDGGFWWPVPKPVEGPHGQPQGR